MEAKKIRLTMDLDPVFQRRLETAAAPSHRFNRQSFESVVARRRELFAGRPLPGDSADLIREAREIRDAQIENWA